jgi:hypothetical protein
VVKAEIVPEVMILATFNEMVEAADSQPVDPLLTLNVNP